MKNSSSSLSCSGFTFQVGNLINNKLMVIQLDVKLTTKIQKKCIEHKKMFILFTYYLILKNIYQIKNKKN